MVVVYTVTYTSSCDLLFVLGRYDQNGLWTLVGFINVPIYYMYTVHTWIGHAFPYCNQIFLVPFGDFFIHFLHLVRVHCPEAALARVGTICVRILNLLEALIQGEVVSHGILVSEPANV